MISLLKGYASHSFSARLPANRVWTSSPADQSSLNENVPPPMKLVISARRVPSIAEYE